MLEWFGNHFERVKWMEGGGWVGAGLGCVKELINPNTLDGCLVLDLSHIMFAYEYDQNDHSIEIRSY